MADPAEQRGADPAIVVDWEVPDRYNGLDVTERFDTDFDGEPESSSEADAYVLPDSWPVTLKGCQVVGATGASSWTWEWKQGGVYLPIPGSGCEVTFDFPAEGTYGIRVSAETDGGTVVTEDQVVVQDLLIVGLGDSYGAGEGAPQLFGICVPGFCPNEIKELVWSNPRCHRSYYSDQAEAARRLERADRRTSVTFIHLACSGAQVGQEGWGTTAEGGGLLTDYDGVDKMAGIAPGGDPPTALVPQLDQVRLWLDRADPDALPDREVDAVILSGGGNDANFVPIMTECATPYPWFFSLSIGTPYPGCWIDIDHPPYKSAGALFREAFEGTPAVEDVPERLSVAARYNNLQTGLAGLGVTGSEIYVREYPDPTWDHPWLQCVTMLGFIDPIEVAWSRDVVLRTLNQTIEDHATTAGWNYVGGVTDAFREDAFGDAHGECSWSDRWINQPADSFLGQGDHTGIMHPNREGYRAMGDLIFHAMDELLSQVEPECVPTVTSHVTGDEVAGWDLTASSSIACGSVAAYVWQAGARSRGYASGIHVDPNELRCGFIDVWVRAISDRGVSSAPFVRRIAADQEIPTSGEAVTGDPSGFPLGSTTEVGLCGDYTETSGWPEASVGWADCLLDPTAAVQENSARMPCPGMDAGGYGRSTFSETDAAEEHVLALDRTVRSDGDVPDPAIVSTVRSDGAYLVVALPGTEVLAEAHLDQSLSMQVAAHPSAGGVDASGGVESDIQGAINRHRPGDPSCEGGEGVCPPFETTEVGFWRLDGYLYHSYDDGVASGEVTERVFSETSTIVDTFFTLERVQEFTPETEVIPLTLAAGDIVTTRVDMSSVGSLTNLGGYSGQVGLNLDIIPLTEGATLVPLASVAPKVTIDDSAFAEGDTGSSVVEIPVSLSVPADEDVELGIVVSPVGSSPATEDADFADVSDPVIIPAGATTAVIDTTIIGDRANEGDETFEVRLQTVRGGGAFALDPTITVTITDDDVETALTPDAPGTPDIDLAGRDATISWALGADNGSPLTAHEVELEDLTASATTTHAAGASGPFTEADLLADHEYRARVRAENAAGWGEWSDWSMTVDVVCATGFTDVPATHPFCFDIAWLVAKGWTSGYPDDTFRPAAAITRQSMAAFLYRMAGEPTFVPPATPSFSDVPTGHPFFTEIEWLASTGVTGGYADGTFRPGATVTRQSIAAFLYRTAGEPAFVPPATPTFSDVPTGHPFFAEIEWLASTGVTGGFSDGTYRPGASVTRQSIAAFLHRFNALGP